MTETDSAPYEAPQAVCACETNGRPLPGYQIVNAGCKLHAAAIMSPHGWEVMSQPAPAKEGAARMHQP